MEHLNYTAFTVDLLILSYKVAYGIVMRIKTRNDAWFTGTQLPCTLELPVILKEFAMFSLSHVTCFIFIIAIG